MAYSPISRASPAIISRTSWCGIGAGATATTSGARSPRPACSPATICRRRPMPARAYASPRSWTAPSATGIGNQIKTRLGGGTEPACDLGHVMALEAREVQLLLRRLARTVRRRDGAGAIGRAAPNPADIGQVRRRVGQADDNHAVMQKRPMERDNGGLVAAAGAGRGEHAADFADQSALDPERPGLVEEVPHLRAHIAEAGRRAEDDCVVIGELL